MRSILQRLSRPRWAARRRHQDDVLRALPDHLRRDIGLPEHGLRGTLARQLRNPIGW
jgi:hypothetical protein